MPVRVTDADIARHERLIQHFARQFALNRDMIEDLEQEGRLETFRALQRFDPAKRVTETTYVAHAVKGAMLHYLRDQAHMIRVPGWQHEKGNFAQRVVSLDSTCVRPAGNGNSPVVDPTANTENAALAREYLSRSMRRARLSPRQRDALVSEVLGTSPPAGTRKVVLASKDRAREKLRKVAA